MDVCLSSRGLGLGVVQMRVVMYIFSTYFPCCVRNVWDRRSLCGHCRVILPTYLPTKLKLIPKRTSYVGKRLARFVASPPWTERVFHCKSNA